MPSLTKVKKARSGYLYLKQPIIFCLPPACILKTCACIIRNTFPEFDYPCGFFVVVDCVRTYNTLLHDTKYFTREFTIQSFTVGRVGMKKLFYQILWQFLALFLSTPRICFSDLRIYRTAILVRGFGVQRTTTSQFYLRLAPQAVAGAWLGAFCKSSRRSKVPRKLPLY